MNYELKLRTKLNEILLKSKSMLVSMPESIKATKSVSFISFNRSNILK